MGSLERKTNQKVLGKHLWETRYFKLSTHSLSIYTNDRTNIAESIIKLSSIISVNRNTKNDGTDLKNNRFDINTRDQILNLRTENQIVCQQWIHFLSLERKKHRKSIRNGLESLESLESTSTKRRSHATTTPKKQNNNTLDSKQNQNIKAPVRRFKRQRTSRADNNDDNNDEDSTSSLKKKHSRNLSMKSWATSVEQRHHDSISYDNQQNELEKQKTGLLTKTASFQGFLIRKIGHKNNKIGEKIYFRLSDDTLEFSKIDEIIRKDDINKIHSSNILGTISVEHIKSVKMVSDENDDQFVIVFNENESFTDWILKTERNDQGNAIKWVNVLQRAQKEAKEVAKTINKIKNNGYNNTNDDDDDDDSEEGDDDSDSQQTTTSKK